MFILYTNANIWKKWLYFIQTQIKKKKHDFKLIFDILIWFYRFFISINVGGKAEPIKIFRPKF